MQRRLLAKSFLSLAPRNFSRHSLILACLFTGVFSHKFMRKVYTVANTKLPTSQSAVKKFDLYTEELYEQALKDKKDIIIFVDPERFRDSFQQEIGGLLEKLVAVRSLTSRKR
jgi:hypothetical protein